MIHLDLFGYDHQFQIADQSPEAVHAALDLIQNLSKDIPTLPQRERSYLLLALRLAMLYQEEKNALTQIEAVSGKCDAIYAMIEKSLETSQNILVHEARVQSDF